MMIKTRAIHGFAIFWLLFVLSPALSQADDWDRALRRAKKDDKPVVLYFFTPACPYCRAMDKEVLADKEINTILQNGVVYVRIDVDKRDDLSRFYGVRGYPTTTFLEPNGQKIVQIPGYIEKSDFKKILTFLQGKKYKTMNLREFLRKSALNVLLVGKT